MKPVLIITHLMDRHDGLVRSSLEEAGCPVITANPADGDALPVVGEIAAIVSLGGDQSATRAAEHAFLTAEVSLMAAALEREVPVLGMCLGAQVLAVAAGGHVHQIGHMYAGWPPLTPLPALAQDPVFASLPPGLHVLNWHEDMIELPPGATELAVTPNPGVELFRVGASAWGSQAHLELVPEMLDGWLASDGAVPQLESAGHTLHGFRLANRERLPMQMKAARPAFAAFARVARAAVAGRPTTTGSSGRAVRLDSAPRHTPAP